MNMNDLIRAAAGRTVVAAPESELEPTVGSIGVGRGGGAVSRQPSTSSSEISNAIRHAANRVRGRVSDLADLELNDLIGGK
jgi:hypothetical protein